MDKLEDSCKDQKTVCIFDTSSLFWFWVPLNFHSYHPVLPQHLGFWLDNVFIDTESIIVMPRQISTSHVGKSFPFVPHFLPIPPYPFPFSAHSWTSCALELSLPAALLLGSTSSQLSAKMYICTSEPFDVISLLWWGSSPVVLSALTGTACAIHCQLAVIHSAFPCG